MKLAHKKPCVQCPFLKSSVPGWFGNEANTPELYLSETHGENGVPCHMSVNEGKSHACVGSLQHANASHKCYRNSDLYDMQKLVGNNSEVLDLQEFQKHHMSKAVGMKWSKMVVSDHAIMTEAKQKVVEVSPTLTSSQKTAIKRNSKTNRFEVIVYTKVG